MTSKPTNRAHPAAPRAARPNLRRSRTAPLEDLQAVLSRHDGQIDEPETISFMAAVRERGLLTDDEWAKVLQWLDDAMAFLKRPAPLTESGVLILDDADPRNADWIRIARAQRLAGHLMPKWASLWLWWIGYTREHGPFWKRVGAVAEERGYPKYGVADEPPEGRA